MIEGAQKPRDALSASAGLIPTGEGAKAAGEFPRARKNAFGMKAAKLVHPPARAKLRRLGQMPCDISAGRLASRGPVSRLTSELMVDKSAAGVDVAVGRLLALASDRLGVEAMTVCAAITIATAPGAGP